MESQLFDRFAIVEYPHSPITTSDMEGISAPSYFAWVCDGGFLQDLKRLWIYRPLLAVFLTARVMIDTWDSMFFEVSLDFLLDLFRFK